MDTFTITTTDGETSESVVIIGANNGGGGLNLMYRTPGGSVAEINLSHIVSLVRTSYPPCAESAHGA